MRPTRHVTLAKEITPDYAAFWSAFIQVFRNRELRVTTGFICDRFLVAVEDDRPAADWKVSELAGCNRGFAAMRSECEALHGSVEIEACPGKGTRITFAFPKHATNYEGHTARTNPLLTHG